MRYVGIALVIVVLLMLAGCNNSGTDQVEPDLLSEKVSAELLAAIENTNKSSLHVIIEFNGTPTTEERANMSNYGLGYLRYYGNGDGVSKWIATLNLSMLEYAVKNHKIVSFGLVNADMKMRKRVASGDFNEWAIHEDGDVSVSIIFFKDVSEEQANKLFETYGAEKEYMGDEVGYGPVELYNLYQIKISPDMVNSIASEDEVEFIEEKYPASSIID